MTEKPIMCLVCRQCYSELEIEKATKCPGCGDTGIPADKDKKHSICLTDHEWRTLFMWAENYATILDNMVTEPEEKKRCYSHQGDRTRST